METRTKGKTKKLISGMLVMLMCLSMFVSVMPVSAAGFSGSGKGTKSEPYLVTNAQQLNEIRNNLKAHYKLANTVDMSSYGNFKPIGSIKTPFTGTFSCDTNSDGTPKYIIKNIKIHVTPKGATQAEGYSGYKEDGSSGWECGLFGKAKGATFKNIVILNADVKSTVEGQLQYSGNPAVFNPGQDDNATGILLAIGEKVTVQGCGVGGTVVTSSNNAGGLAGRLTGGSSVKNCYAYVNIASTGWWAAGGFAGNVVNGKIDACFYNGTFDGSGHAYQGAFVGQVTDNSSATNCWATGKVKEDSSGCFVGFSSTDSGYKNVKDSYTLVVIEGRTRAQTSKNTNTNCWITDAVGGLQSGFAAGSQSEINSAFKTLSAWTVADGTYPQLKNVHPVTDASKYVPGANATASGDTTANGNTTTSQGQTGETTGDTTEDVTEVEGTEENTGTTVTTEVNVDSSEITKMERVILVVLLTFFVLVMGLTIVTLLLNLRFLSKCKGNVESKGEKIDAVRGETN